MRLANLARVYGMWFGIETDNAAARTTTPRGPHHLPRGRRQETEPCDGITWTFDEPRQACWQTVDQVSVPPIRFRIGYGPVGSCVRFQSTEP